MCWFTSPDKYWVLVSGQVGGATAVFEIGVDAVKTVWMAAPEIGDVTAYAHPVSLLWEIEYADMKRFYAGRTKARLLDIYQIDFLSQTWRRIVLQVLE